MADYPRRRVERRRSGGFIGAEDRVRHSQKLESWKLDLGFCLIGFLRNAEILLSLLAKQKFKTIID